MIVGMSLTTEVCQIRGQDSRNSFYRKKDFQKDICGPGADKQKYKQLQCLRISGSKRGPK